MKGVLLILLLFATSATAQRVRLIYGNLRGLKYETSYNREFVYDSMMIGRNIPEQIYLDKKRMQWENRELGKGDRFVKLWFDKRQELYQPAFVQNFERLSKIKINDKNAKYTLVIKTKLTEGGWYAWVINHPGAITGELWIVESVDHSKVKAKIRYRSYGNVTLAGDFEMPARIRSAYAFAGAGLGDFLKSKSRK